MTKDQIIKNAEKIDGWMLPGELEAIYDACQSVLKKGSLAVEVGSYHGRSSYVIASVCKEKGAKLICMDTFCGCASQDYLYVSTTKEAIEEFIAKDIGKNLKGLPVEYIVGDSTETYKQIEDNSADYIFIDGEHYNPGVTKDIDNFWPKVKKGGTYSGHDYSEAFQDVLKAVNKKFPDRIERETKFSIWLVRDKK